MQHLLLTDESILAVCLMDPDFHIADAASMPAIEKFKITDKVRDSAGAFAATMLGMISLIDGTFGETKRMFEKLDIECV